MGLFARLTQGSAGAKPDGNNSSVEILNRFEEAKKRLQTSPYFQEDPDHPYGLFDGRIIIGEEPPIHGGVYIGATPQEAVVVDEKYGNLEPLYMRLLVKFLNLQKNGSSQITEEIIPFIFEFAQDSLELSTERVRSIIKDQEIEPDQKVTLDLFLLHKTGLPRHQILLAAYLIEKLINKGYLQGQLKIEADFSYEELEEESLTFTSSSGTVHQFTPRSHVTHIVQ